MPVIDNSPRELVLLVGGNPLPNYVAACALKDRDAIQSVHLLFTKEVETVKDRLRDCLRRHLGLGCRETELSDPANAERITREADAITPGAHFHYSGGTNAMAVHTYLAWLRAGGSIENASYLYGQDVEARLTTDSGVQLDLSNVQLSLDVLAELQGLEDAKTRSASDVGPTAEDVSEVVRKVILHPELALMLYEMAPAKEPKKASDWLLPINARDHGLKLSEAVIPHSSWSGDQIKAWWKFFRKSEWLEIWVDLQVKATRLVKEEYVYVGAKPKIQGREFELDVVAIRGHRLYLVSCTAERKAPMCKLKLFEAATRARQLGGDLARSALVCLADDSVVQELKKDVTTVSLALKEPAVFGLPHVREWVGSEGTVPNLSTLSEWLTK